MSKRVAGSELFNVTYTRPRSSRVDAASLSPHRELHGQNYLCRDRPIYVKTLLTGADFDGADCISRFEETIQICLGFLSLRPICVHIMTLI